MDCIPPVVLAAPESEVKKHPDYHAAKGGDADAAFRLIRDLLTERAVTELADLAGNDRPMLVAVHAEEEFGKNAIPEALADVLGVRLGLDVEETIVQANVVNHTGADGFSRLARQAVFAGDVKRHQLFVMVDDFVGQGGTLANLKGHI
jgi:indole-3-glycerol phosphate synthase